MNVVINLATSKSEGAIANEGALISGLGMEYVNIPVDLNKPSKENLDAFLNTMDKHKDEHILVHCQANFRATGFVALYHILRLGRKKDDAFQDMQKVWNPEEYPVWDMFIEENLPPE